MERKVKDLVRFVIFSELKRSPIRREEMVKKGMCVCVFYNIKSLFITHTYIFLLLIYYLIALQEFSRNYQNILLEAREQLQDILGMDLVELPTKEKKVVRGGANSKGRYN